MSALREAERFVRLHSRYMGLRRGYVDGVLRRITSMDGEGPGSWPREWSQEADTQARKDRPRRAASLYNLARFPFADTPARQRAAAAAAASFAGWMASAGIGERRATAVGSGAVPFLFRAGVRSDAPLVILMGGIVSLKEQWGEFLRLGPRLGCAIAIADFPGVGENRVRYDRAAAAVYGALMDAVSDRCDATHTFIAAPSFGGHLALLHALADRRVSAIATVGAPLARFFLDPMSLRAMPSITRAALRHCASVSDAALDGHLRDLALTPAEIAALSVPVLYVASLRDEIIPAGDWQEAAALSRRFRVHVFDDVHGSPHHLMQTRLLTLEALNRHGGRRWLATWLGCICRIAVHSVSTNKVKFT